MRATDTLDYLEQLKRAGFPEEKALAIVRSPESRTREWLEDHFATKDYLKHEIGDLRADMGKAHTGLKQEISELRADMEKGQAQLRADMEKGHLKLQRDLTKWMFYNTSAAFGLLASLITVLHFTQ